MIKPRTTLALLILTGAAGLAQAQPVEPTPPDAPEGMPIPVDEPSPPPSTEPMVANSAPPAAAEAPAGDRPEGGIAFGIGLGYQLPTSLETPNITSVRLRLPSGLTFEPFLTLANQSQTTDTGLGESTTSRSDLGAGTVVRLPVIRHGKIELELLGSAGVRLTKVNPDGNDNNTTSTSFGVGWGLACSYWLTQHWNLTLSATNPLISLSSSSEEQPAGMNIDSSSRTIGLTFDPVVSAMIHLYN